MEVDERLVDEAEFGPPVFEDDLPPPPGPPPAGPLPLVRRKRSPRPKTKDVRMSADYAAALTLALGVLSARLLALLALLGAIGIFVYAALEPSRWLVAVSYAAGVLMPALVLSYLKG